MTIQNDQGVVDLPTAQVPADQGLSSLGLIMQLAGTLFAAFISLFMFMTLLTPRMGGDGTMLWIFLVLGLCVARSFYHRAAGTELLYGRRTLSETPVSAFAGVRRYVAVALGQTVLLAALMKIKFDVPGHIIAGVAGGLAVWPVTLLIIFSLPRFKRIESGQLPIAEDKGFEGASILMAIFGTCGVLATGTILVLMLRMGGKAMQQGPMVLILLAVGMLVVRSAIHVQAGLSGIRETSIDRSVELANRYANFGVISSFCAAGAILLMIMTMGMNVMGLAFISGACWLLMSWPMIVRRFFSDRQFADLLAGEGTNIHRRAPDAGLSGLGWLLVAQAAFGATILVFQLGAGSGDADGMTRMMASLSGPSGMRSVWFSVGLTVLQAWAGWELIRMSAQHKLIGLIYGVVATGLTLYMVWPLIDLLKHSGRGFGLGTQELTMMIGPIAIQLVIPIATILLLARKIAPTATARFRQKPADGVAV